MLSSFQPSVQRARPPGSRDLRSRSARACLSSWCFDSHAAGLVVHAEQSRSARAYLSSLCFDSHAAGLVVHAEQ